MSNEKEDAVVSRLEKVAERMEKKFNGELEFGLHQITQDLSVQILKEDSIRHLQENEHYVVTAGRSKWNGGGRVGVFVHNKGHGAKKALHDTQKPLSLFGASK